MHNGAMRLIALLLAIAPIFAQSSDEKDVIAVVQKLFDGMAAHDEAAIRAAMLPDARLYSIRGEAAPAAIEFDGWAKRTAASKTVMLERFIGKPSVSIRGRMAQLWGEYEFLRDGKFSHCGVDTVTLFKTAEGWKIAILAFTMETAGCKQP
jgi:hypothetical protein